VHPGRAVELGQRRRRGRGLARHSGHAGLSRLAVAAAAARAGREEQGRERGREEKQARGGAHHRRRLSRGSQWWQELQAPPLSTCGSGALRPWHERQSMAGECGGTSGLGAASRWLGVPLWHTEQEVSDFSGWWQERQCVAIGAPQKPTWLSGLVSAW